MYLKSLELSGFKSFAKKTNLEFSSPVVSIVGPNGSGKSNVVEAIRFVLGEQSMKSMRGKGGTDLIFKGSKNLSKMSRASVSIVFDNRNKIFKTHSDTAQAINLDYDEITLKREVFADGASSYSVNGSEVRLKDIFDILSSVNIGSSSHHIISQGEADRILNSSSKERRGMIEDALGLKIYQYRLKESERKLEKTRGNVKEVQSLRREIAPHIQFLKKQVEKIEKAQELRNELESLYREYLKRESNYIGEEERRLNRERASLTEKLEDVNAILAEEPEQASRTSDTRAKIDAFDNKLRELRRFEDDLSRKLGRLEGMIEMEERRARMPKKEDGAPVPYSDIKNLISDIERSIDDILKKQTIADAYPIIQKLQSLVRDFLPKNKIDTNESPDDSATEIARMRDDKQKITKELEKLKMEEEALVAQTGELKNKIEEDQTIEREANKKRFEYQMKRQEMLVESNLLLVKEEQLAKTKTDLEEEIKEGSILVGSAILSYKDFEIPAPDQSRSAQEERRKKIERYKIRLEDSGASGGNDILKEYTDATERDNFLVKELSDLTDSMKSLEQLITDLKSKLDLEFNVGVEKINKQFQNFFSLMFGGGSAFLSIIVEEKRRRRKADDEEEMEIIDNDEEEGLERGIEINVTLPHKKVKELAALSGGERSLTSIALLFAISQVNPPPFLVLDETDAALDEANSRKYGDMIENLSKYSQLIVVTHNRETMSRAQVLYGVTIGSDGASKLLSVKFDEAVAIAK
ncbi:MAG: AAA family ATPase [Candidatus Paceibacterota bacterium]|jgi:chromosome segregation protein